MKRNAKNAVETVEVEAEIAGGTPAERINTYVREAQRHGRIALEYLVKAGWELLIQKQSIGHGGWLAWCKDNLCISNDTADRYIQFYQRTLGDKRSEARIAITREPTKKELADATAGMEYKTATQAMVDMGIVKRPAAWGGAGRGQGRKSKNAVVVSNADVAKELETIATMEPVLWASAKGALDTLRRLDSEKNFMHRLSDKHLSELAELLADLSKKADELSTNRLNS